MPSFLRDLAPWRDRDGRTSPLRLVVLAALAVPVVWIAARIGFDDLGPRPITEVLRFCGDRAIETLIATIAVTPLRRISGAAKLIGIRRMLGLAAATWAFAHLGLFAVDQGFDLGKAAFEIATRSYLALGFVAIVGLAALAATSTDGQIRRLGGARWKRLHGLVHPIVMLGLVHELLQVRLDPSHLALLCGLAAAGLAARIATRDGPAPALVVVPAVAIAGFLGGAAGELAWFVAKTKRPLGPVLAGNLDAAFAVPPSWVAAAIATAITLGGLAARRWRARRGRG